MTLKHYDNCIYMIYCTPVYKVVCFFYNLGTNNLISGSGAAEGCNDKWNLNLISTYN